MMVGCSAHTVVSRRHRSEFEGLNVSVCHVIKGFWPRGDLHVYRAERSTRSHAGYASHGGGPPERWPGAGGATRSPSGDRQRGEGGRSGSPPAHSVARGPHRAISSTKVMSASVKPRLAGRQPSNRGGVPRVMTRLSSQQRLRRQARVRGDGPPE